MTTPLDPQFPQATRDRLQQLCAEFGADGIAVLLFNGDVCRIRSTGVYDQRRDVILRVATEIAEASGGFVIDRSSSGS